MPESDDVEQGILQGMYRFSKDSSAGLKVHLLGSGSLMQEVLDAAEILKQYGCSTDIWSVTSYNQLLRQAQSTERANMLNPQQSQMNYIEQLLANERGAFVAVSDYLKSLPNAISAWFPGGLSSLGTDGFGLSESRPTLRDHFEVDARYIAWSALTSLFRQGQFSEQQLEQARTELSIPTEKADPMLF